MDKIVLSEVAKAELRRSFQDLNLHPYEDIETFLISIYPICANLPRMYMKLSAFRNDPQAYGALLPQNFPIDDNLPPTPSNGRPSRTKKTFIPVQGDTNWRRILVKSTRNGLSPDTLQGILSIMATTFLSS